MTKFIVKRIIYAIITIFLLATLTFFMMRWLPGEPFIGPKAINAVTKAALLKKYGLDKPVGVQYLMYMKNALKGDFGISLKSNRPISIIIKQAFPYSFDLGIRALIFAVVFGIGLGSLAALKRGTKWDTMAMFISVIGVSIPSFIVGAILQYFISVKLGDLLGYRLFPVQGWNSEMSKILPSLALGLGSLATISRLMRTSMLDVLNSDYIKTAKSKGLSSRAITIKHGLRNALLPVITVLGPIAATVLTGAFVVERVFNVPGMGRFFVDSIVAQDYTLIAGTTLFYGAFLVMATLLVDIAYFLIDPRIRLTGGKNDD